MRLEWVSQLWDDRRGESAHIVPMGSCTECDVFQAAWGEIVERLLPQPTTTSQLADEAWAKVHSLPPVCAELGSSIAAEQTTAQRMKSMLFLLVANNPLVRVFLIEEAGAGCVQACHEISGHDERGHASASLVPATRAQAVSGYDAGALFVLVDTMDADEICLLAASEIRWPPAAASPLPLRVPPSPLAAPLAEALTTEALLKRARLALQTMRAVVLFQ